MIRIGYYYKPQTFKHLLASPFPLSVFKQGKSYLKERKGELLVKRLHRKRTFGKNNGR